MLVVLALRWEGPAPGITQNLIDRIAQRGGIVFDRMQAHRNSWASMFAWQALTFARSRGEMHPRELACSLIWGRAGPKQTVRCQRGAGEIGPGPLPSAGSIRLQLGLPNLSHASSYSDRA